MRHDPIIARHVDHALTLLETARTHLDVAIYRANRTNLPTALRETIDRTAEGAGSLIAQLTIAQDELSRHANAQQKTT